MVYDGDGNRVAKTVSGVTTRYLVDDLNPTGYAQVIDELIRRSCAARLHLRPAAHQPGSDHQQHLDAELLRLRRRGQRAQFDQCGRARHGHLRLRCLRNKVAFNGHNAEYLPATAANNTTPILGCISPRARYYNSLTGRFLSRDSEDRDITNPATLHRYLYAAGDPVDLADPLGRAAQPVPLPPVQNRSRCRNYRWGLLVRVASSTLCLLLRFR